MPAKLTDAQIGLRIRHIRTKKKLTAKQLSLKLGWAPSRVSRIECVDMTLFMRDIIALAEALEIKLADLLADEFEI